MGSRSRISGAPFLPISLDPSSPEPLYDQLCRSIRQAIRNGSLASGSRLPSTRDLARDLGVSRNTVLAAFDQLLAEGYLEGRTGAGTFVATELPDDLLAAKVAPPGGAQTREPRGGPDSATTTHPRRLARRADYLAGLGPAAPGGIPAIRAFRSGVPALDEFPVKLWSQLVARQWKHPGRALLGHGDPLGYPPLRKALADYLGAARAIRCDPGQILIVSGSQQAFDLAARVLLDSGEPAWVEDPSYRGVISAWSAAGARIVPMPVDAEGLNPDAAPPPGPPRLIHVTPSSQYPLTVTMTMARRERLLRFAAASEAWILEDDYDSEYRYHGAPLPALFAMDSASRVVYAGTFTKTLFPSLRLGFLVLPPDLVDVFLHARLAAVRFPPSIEQAVLADFIDGGHLMRHIRRMRALYLERQQILLDAAAGEVGSLMRVDPAPAGMHLIGLLPNRISDRDTAAEARRRGVDTQALSAYCLGPAPWNGLLLGYAGYSERELRLGMKRLAAALATTSA